MIKYSPNPVPIRSEDWHRFLTDEFERIGNALLVERPRYIGATNEPAFQNSWVNYGTGTENVNYYRDPFDRVHIGGTMASGTVGSVSFNLPPAYRPNNQLRFSSIDGTGTPSARIHVDSNGDVTVQAGNNAYVSLDGHSWRV